MNPTLKLFLSGLTAGIIACGGAILTAMQGSHMTPDAWVLAAVTGFVAAAKDWRTYLAQSPKAIAALAMVAVIIGAGIPLSGCTTMPPVNTMNKRMALFEITYNQLLIEAIQYAREGRLTKAQALKVDAAFKQIDTARAAAYAAIAAGNSSAFDSQQALISAALSTVRSVLVEVEKNGSSYRNHSGNRYSQLGYHRSGQGFGIVAAGTARRPGCIGGGIANAA